MFFVTVLFYLKGYISWIVCHNTILYSILKMKHINYSILVYNVYNIFKQLMLTTT